jgi:hypothetical protein
MLQKNRELNTATSDHINFNARCSRVPWCAKFLIEDYFYAVCWPKAQKPVSLLCYSWVLTQTGCVLWPMRWVTGLGYSGDPICVHNLYCALGVLDVGLADVGMFHHIKSRLFLQIKAFNKLREKAITGGKGNSKKHSNHRLRQEITVKNVTRSGSRRRNENCLPYVSPSSCMCLRQPV